MDILDDMGVSKLSAKVVLKVNYSFKAYSMSRYKLLSIHEKILRNTHVLNILVK